MLGVGGPTEESELLALIEQTGKQTWEEVRKTKWVKRMERGQGLCVRVCVRARACARPQGETCVGGSGRPSSFNLELLCGTKRGLFA